MRKHIFKRIFSNEVRFYICNVLEKQKRLNRHMKHLHPHVDHFDRVPSIVAADKVDPKKVDNKKSGSIVPKLYKCIVCGVEGIKKGNLTEHQSTKHNNIPIKSKIFELTEVRQMIQCDVCEKRMRDDELRTHQLKDCFQRIGFVKTETFDDNPSIDSHSSDDTDF